MTYDTQGRRIIGPQSTWEGECKALRVRVAELEEIARDYRLVLHSAKTGRDLYLGWHIAKEYRFTRQQIDAALAKINDALNAPQEPPEATPQRDNKRG